MYVPLPPGPPPCSFFFFNDTATTEIYTLSLHDALPILSNPKGMSKEVRRGILDDLAELNQHRQKQVNDPEITTRSEEHTSELQSPDHLVCRLLLEKKKKYVHLKKTDV